MDKYDNFPGDELFSLDLTIAKFILPRLKEFKKVSNANDGWDEALDEMIIAFQLMIDNDGEIGLFNDKEKMNTIYEGLDSFRDNFFSLWY